MTEPNKIIPEEIAKIYEPLSDELIWVHAKWQMYREVFGRNEETIDLLNKSAGAFFGIYQEVLLHDVMLGICRILDPEKTGPKDNLTLERLINSIDQDKYGKLRLELENDLKTAIDCAAFAREHRNRKLAHNDLETIKETGAAPLPGVSRAAVENIFRRIRDMMNKISSHFLDTTVLYENFIFGPGDADALIRLLNDAEEFRRNRKLF